MDSLNKTTDLFIWQYIYMGSEMVWEIKKDLLPFPTNQWHKVHRSSPNHFSHNSHLYILAYIASLPNNTQNYLQENAWPISKVKLKVSD